MKLALTTVFGFLAFSAAASAQTAELDVIHAGFMERNFEVLNPLSSGQRMLAFGCMHEVIANQNIPEAYAAQGCAAIAARRGLKR